MRQLLIVLVVFGVILADTSEAKRKTYDWDEITSADWNYTVPGDSLGNQSCVLHEKVTFNERKLLKNKVYLTLYRRIRIRSASDRTYGDVDIPLFMRDQKVEKTFGRTVLPDGTEKTLDDHQVFERELIKSDKRRVMQTAFSVPGVTDDCIVEYAYTIKLPGAPGVWRFQQDMPVRLGELRWQLFLGDGLTDWSKIAFRTRWAPTYVTLHCDSAVEIQHLPSKDDCSEIVFTLHEVAPLEDEPFTLPDVARKTQIHCFYGVKGTSKNYWDRKVVEFVGGAKYFCKKNSKLQPVVESLDTLPSQTQKIEAAYAWIQNNLKNASYDPDIENPKDISNVDDAIMKGYAHTSALNMVFYDLLRQLGVDAYVALVTDRDERLFIQDAQYWQFDHWIVAVRVRGSNFEYYSPGDACLEAGQIRWQNEGVTVLICGVVIDQFQAMPYSGPEENRLYRSVEVMLSEDGGATGTCSQEEWGHVARASKLLCLGDDGTESEQAKAERLEKTFTNGSISGMAWSICEGPAVPVAASCSVSFSHPNPPTANRWVVNPFQFMAAATNPFTKDVRESPVLFDYAYETEESVALSWPTGWRPATLPSDTTFKNWAGSCAVHFDATDSGLTVVRRVRLKRAYFKPQYYDRVQRLFASYAQLSELNVLLHKP